LDGVPADQDKQSSTAGLISKALLKSIQELDLLHASGLATSSTGQSASNMPPFTGWNSVLDKAFLHTHGITFFV